MTEGAGRVQAANDGLIHWLCTSREHSKGRVPGLAEHRGQWAICPERFATDHAWAEIRGSDVRVAVERWRRLTGDVREPTPAT